MVCAAEDGDVYRDEVRRLKVELEAARTKHVQELKAKNDYVRPYSVLRGREGRGCFTLFYSVCR